MAIRRLYLHGVVRPEVVRSFLASNSLRMKFRKLYTYKLGRPPHEIFLPIDHVLND